MNGASSAASRLGLIAGGGKLPIALANRCLAAGRPLFVIRLRGFADAEMQAYPGVELGLGELGGCFSALKAAGCRAICFAGKVDRPDFAALKPDLRGLRALPRAIAAAGRGDDALLRFLVGEFEREGFVVEGAEAVDGGLALPLGSLARHSPDAAAQADIVHGVRVARALGALDIGQGVVVCNGLILAVEAQEGTDAMLRRCRELPAAIRGARERPRGVLVKWPKPAQERRIDLPTMGVATLEAAAAAGLAGVAGEARGTLLLDRSAMIAAADHLGLFLVGVAREAE